MFRRFETFWTLLWRQGSGEQKCVLLELDLLDIKIRYMRPRGKKGVRGSVYEEEVSQKKMK